MPVFKAAFYTARGVLVLSEPLTLRLVLAVAMILGGIALVITGRKKNPEVA